MFNFFASKISYEDDDALHLFKKEGDWLTKKRDALIAKDKLTDNHMLINNPSRGDITLRHPTVLKGQQ